MSPAIMTMEYISFLNDNASVVLTIHLYEVPGGDGLYVCALSLMINPIQLVLIKTKFSSVKVQKANSANYICIRSLELLLAPPYSVGCTSLMY